MSMLNRFRGLAPVIAVLIGFSVHGSAQAQVIYYWDTDSTTPGFGTASGIWGTDPFLSTDPAGSGTTTATPATTTADTLNFGTSTVGLASGTITVGTTQSIGSLNFGSASGAITLSGGTAINFAAVGTITVNNASNTISTKITGAATSLTKAGMGTLTLNNAQSNTYTGSTFVNAGTLVEITSSTGAWTRSSASTTISSGGTLKLDFSAQTGAIQQNNVKNISVNSGGTLELIGTIQNVDGTTISTGSTITGSGTINKTGVGVVETFNGPTFSFSGQINIVAGAFANNNITWTGNPSVDIASGAYLDTRFGTTAIDKLTGTGTVGTSFSSAATLTVGNANGSSTFDVIS
jgi:autotransporter-associated beta strand protein